MDIDQKKVLQALRLAPPQGVKAMELAQTLTLDAKARHRLRKALEELENEAKIERAPGGRYRLPEAERPKPKPAAPSAVAEITRYPEAGDLAARVIHILGPVDDPRTEVAKVIACADIPDTFPEDVLAAARRTPQALAADDFADRIDLRDRAFLTIDPE